MCGRSNWEASVELGLGSAAAVLWSRQHKIHKIQGTRNTTTPAHDNGFRVNQSDTARSDVCRYTFSPLHRNEARHQQQRLEGDDDGWAGEHRRKQSRPHASHLAVNELGQWTSQWARTLRCLWFGTVVVPCLAQALINHRLGHCSAWPQAYSSTSDTLNGGCQMTIRAVGE